MSLTAPQRLALQRLEDGGVPVTEIDTRTADSLTTRGLARRTLTRGKHRLEITDAGRAALEPRKRGRAEGYERPPIKLPDWASRLRGVELLALIRFSRIPESALVISARVQVTAVVDEALRLAEGWRRPARQALGITRQEWAALIRDPWVSPVLAKYPCAQGEPGHRRTT